MLHLICDSILSMYCQSCYSVCKPDIDLVLDVHPVERPARAYRNTSRAPRGRCLDPHVGLLLDEHLGQGQYPINATRNEMLDKLSVAFLIRLSILRLII